MTVFCQQISPFLRDDLQSRELALNFSPQDNTSEKVNMKCRKDLQVPHVSSLTFAS